MKWEKTGPLYVPPGDAEWSVSHAQHPTLDRISDDVLRIYFATRDSANRSVTAFIDVEAGDPHNILYRHDRPALGLGELGCFDDAGAMPSWIVENGGVKHLYYIGWNAGVSVAYRNSIGLALGDESGRFVRAYKGPVMDRCKTEPHFCASPCVLIDRGLWRMWYLSATRWVVVNGTPEPVYHIKYAESDDGREWRRPGIVAIPLKSAEEGGLVRPCVIRERNRYRMWFSYRAVSGFRTDRTRSYRIGYAESEDGLTWTRMDERTGIDVSRSGWDSEMIAYPSVYEHKGTLHMIYNGNGFGRTGFGHAVLT